MWNKIKWYIQKFMIGRNGRDELQVAVAYAALILYIFAPWFDKLLPFPFCSFGICIYRANSHKNFVRILWRLNPSYPKIRRSYE